MPIYKGKKPGKFLIRVYSRGRPVSRVVTGTKADAKAAEEKLQRELAAVPVMAVGQIAPAFEVFCVGAYRDHSVLHLAPDTWKTRKYIVEDLADFFGKQKMSRFSVEDVAAYQRKLKDEGLRETTINDRLVILGNVFKVARDMGHPVSLPKVKPLKVRRRKGRVQVWSEEEVGRLYGSIGKLYPWMLGMVVVLINTGMRKGEVCAMEWSWVDLDRGILSIQPNEFWRPKNGEPREVPLGDAVMPWLAVPEAERKSQHYVFPTLRKMGKERGRYSEFPLDQFTRARRAVKLGGSPHVCRHTYASHFLERCPDLDLLAQILGHSHTSVTRIYAHLMPGRLEKARNAVNMAPPLMLKGGE